MSGFSTVGATHGLRKDRQLTKDVVERPKASYPVVERVDTQIRAFKEDVLEHFGNPLIDVRSLEEYTGERTHMPAYPEEGALRGAAYSHSAERAVGAGCERRWHFQRPPRPG
jgi:3-mercaptopyruvate sulfurtransferase SseA